MLIGERGPAAVLSGSSAAWLVRHAKIDHLLMSRAMVADPDIAAEIRDLLQVAADAHGSEVGTVVARRSEPASTSEWLSTREAAERLAITTRAVVKAIGEGRLPSSWVDGRRHHRVHVDDVKRYGEQTAKARSRWT